MEYITMSKKERVQAIVLEKLKNKEISQKEAAAKLGMTRQWVKEKLKRYIEKGDGGLVHKSRGKTNEKRKWNEEEKIFTLNLLSTEWSGFGPTFAVEKLEEKYNIIVSKETLRNEMIKVNLWQGKKRKTLYRQQRERKPMYGMLIQFDGSRHDWFEGKEPSCTLFVAVDDATSKLMHIRFSTGESCEGAMLTMREYLEKHGKPQSLYVDFGGVFSVNINNSERDKLTQFGRAMKELGITIHYAHSPQAKGRVERTNKTLQDRLIKEMRLEGISSIEEANTFAAKFIEKYNVRFAKPAAQKGDAHAPIALYNFNEIFCVKDERILTNDYTITYKKRILQITRRQLAIIRPKDLITIHEQFDGILSLYVRGLKLNFEEIGLRKAKKLSPADYVKSENAINNNTLPLDAHLLPAKPTKNFEKIDYA